MKVLQMGIPITATGSDTHEEIREVEIEYSWRNYGNNGAASIPAIQRSTKDTG